MTTITPETLAKVAKLLGHEEIYSTNNATQTSHRHWVVAMDAGPLGVNDTYWSDGDLLLAILNKAAEIEQGFTVANAVANEQHFAQVQKRTPDFLSAVILAFAQLEEWK